MGWAQCCTRFTRLLESGSDGPQSLMSPERHLPDHQMGPGQQGPEPVAEGLHNVIPIPHSPTLLRRLGQMFFGASAPIFSWDTQC